jgi:predicted permease
MGKLWRRVYFYFHRDRLNRELAEEMDAHREMMPEGRRANFGNEARLQEESREAWSWNAIEEIRQDLSYGFRGLRRAPGFTLGAVVVLALGVGINLAEFEIFDSMIAHRLTVRDAEACLQLTHASRAGHRVGFPSGVFEEYRAGSRSFAWLVSEDTSFEVIADDGEPLRSNLVSKNYFSSLGILPSWGRLLDERDGEPGATVVAVLGYGYWQRQWGSDPNVVGRVIRVNRLPVQIVGVLPYSFDGLSPRRTAIWFPARPVLTSHSVPVQEDFVRRSEAFFGKLKPDVSQAAGEAELTMLTHGLAHILPHSFAEDERILGNPVQQSVLNRLREFPALAIFVAIVLLVLVSACANLGNMLLARGLARQREIDIRLAIGANRARVVRQLMTENLLLAILGSAAGLGAGAFFARVMMSALGAPPDIRIVMRSPVLAAGLVLAFFSAVVFGLPSALRTVLPGSRKTHLRQGLVGVQVAVSCLLLIASAVLAHNGIASATLNLSFDYRNMVVVYPQLYSRNLTPASAREKVDAISSRLAALPGVESITAAVTPPFGGRRTIENLPGLPHLYRNTVGSSYFQAMNVAAVRGRAFAPGDDAGMVVSESAARAMWPNQDPVGKTLRLDGAERSIVGVVRDSGANLLVDPDSVEIYLPLQGADWAKSALILHVRSDPAAVARLVPLATASTNETVSVMLMRGARENFLEAQQKMVILFGAIGAVATTLAAAGMFALVAFAVAQRRRELGIRIAIGAAPRHILQILFGQNAKAMAAGGAAGVVLAAILSKVVRSLIVLQNRDAVDVVGFAAGLAGFVAAAGLATLSPAMRALRIDPSATLREE